MSESSTAEPGPPTHKTSLARRIDVSAVQAHHTEDDVRQLARSAREYGFASAHVLPNWVPLLRDLLPSNTTHVGAPVGFPAGGAVTQVKVAETRQLLATGIEEVDVVINIGRLRSGHDSYVKDDLRAVVETAAGSVPVRAILETALLTEDEIKRACQSAIVAGAEFVKTGTGWTGQATTVATVATIRDFVGNAIKIKASGGIRDLDTVLAMYDLGVDRFGINTQTATTLVQEYAWKKTFPENHTPRGT